MALRIDQFDRARKPGELAVGHVPQILQCGGVFGHSSQYRAATRASMPRYPHSTIVALPHTLLPPFTARERLAAPSALPLKPCQDPLVCPHSGQNLAVSEKAAPHSEQNFDGAFPAAAGFDGSLVAGASSGA